MSTATLPISTLPPPTSATPEPPTRLTHLTGDEWLRALGNIPLNRIIFDPPPGTATVADAERLGRSREKRIVEVVNGTLVEKALGLRESFIAMRLGWRIMDVAEPNRLGLVAGADGMIRMKLSNIRIPDVGYYRRQDLPGGKAPREAAPQLAPAIAVEVLSEGNTEEEMRIRLREYFESGVVIVWMLDPKTETLRIHDAPERFRQLTRDDTLDGGDLLPGFSVRVGELFDV